MEERWKSKTKSGKWAEHRRGDRSHAMWEELILPLLTHEPGEFPGDWKGGGNELSLRAPERKTALLTSRFQLSMTHFRTSTSGAIR